MSTKKFVYQVDVYGSTNKLSRTYEKTFVSAEVATNWGKTEEALLGFPVKLTFVRELEEVVEPKVELAPVQKAVVTPKATEKPKVTATSKPTVFKKK